MDTASEDFSGLPTRGHKDPETYVKSSNRLLRIFLLAGLSLCLSLFVLGLAFFLAPAPYLSMNHSALAESVDASPSAGCFPAGQGWNCVRTVYGTDYSYRVTADWAGCWTGKLVREQGLVNDAKPKITGCVTAFDHIRAE